MFRKETPEEAAVRKLEKMELQLEKLELNLAEANKGIVEVHKRLLENQATVAAVLGDIAKVRPFPRCFGDSNIIV